MWTPLTFKVIGMVATGLAIFVKEAFSDEDVPAWVTNSLDFVSQAGGAGEKLVKPITK
jgi:hypothetical protein